MNPIQSVLSILRHWLTGAAGAAGLWLIAMLALSGDDAKQLTEAFSKLIEPLIVIASLVIVAVSRLAISWLGNLFGRGAEKLGDKLSGVPLWMLLGICTAVAVGGLLPSCSSLSSVPLTLRMDNGKATYSAKGGLEVEIYDARALPPAGYEIDLRSGK